MRVKMIGYGLVIAAVCVFSFVQNAEAGKHKYFQVAELTAKGGAHEIKLDKVKEASWLMIHAIEGHVVVNTVVLREGGKKTPITVATSLNKDQKKEVSLGGRKQLTGIRISNTGGGKYRVYLKK